MTGFDPSSGQQDDLMKRLMAMFGDTGFAGLQALLSRLFGRRGGVAPIDEGGSIAGGSGGGVGGGGGSDPGGGGGGPGRTGTNDPEI